MVFTRAVFFRDRRAAGPARLRETDMTGMTTWDLFEDFRAIQQEMLRMNAGRAWWPGQRYQGGASAAAWAPAVDISERKDAYLVTAELPGVKPGDVEITFEDGLLTIQGERHPASYAAGDKAHRAERRYGAFRRSITLPSHVEADKIEASAQDGVLQVLVPKAEEAQAKHITVRAGQPHAAAISGTAANNGS
jgi:HSP20 family protein